MKRMTFSIALVATLGLLVPNFAIAHPDPETPDGKNGVDGTIDSKEEVYDGHSHQHGSASGHLPAKQEDVELVSKLKLVSREDKISDLAILGDFAYLGEWAGGLSQPSCRGGIYVVDISNPSKPKKRAFLPLHAGTYATEGIHALSVDTPTFTGDLLVVSNEACAKHGIGGFTLFDITNPNNPRKLSEDGGDYSNGDVGSTDTDPVAHQAHSAMAWQDGENVYLIAIDNEEGLDVDFFDITDPRDPVILSETGLEEWEPAVVVDGYGDFPTSHDFDVRFIDGIWYAMVSYWDAGWVLLNVNDPADPTLVDDYDYPECDSFTESTTPGSDVDDRSCPPEGNAHQGEWDDAGDLFLGTDEDFSPYRLLPIEVTENTVGGAAVTGQPAPGTQYEGGEFGWTVPVASLPDGVVNGPVAFGGYGCDEDNQVPPASVLDPFMSGDPDEERILVLQRGPVGDPSAPYDGCFFSIKVENGQDAGYDVVIIANHHAGSSFGSQPDAFFCGGQGHTFTITAHGLCSGHRSMHELFGDSPATYGTSSTDQGYPESDMNDKIGAVGPKIETSSFFDGWGYVRLFEADPPFTEIDQLAIDEQIQEVHATGSGDLTVHEVATGRGPDAGLAYFSWYSGGFRVAEFDDEGIEEVGAFIDEGGNDFWGVQLTDHFVDGDRVVALSDRDFGLYLFRYTGD